MAHTLSLDPLDPFAPVPPLWAWELLEELRAAPEPSPGTAGGHPRDRQGHGEGAPGARTQGEGGRGPRRLSGRVRPPPRRSPATLGAGEATRTKETPAQGLLTWISLFYCYLICCRVSILHMLNGAGFPTVRGCKCVAAGNMGSLGNGKGNPTLLSFRVAHFKSHFIKPATCWNR